MQKHIRSMLVAAGCSAFLFGCTPNKSNNDVKEAANVFFEAYNHIASADYLQAHGNLDAMGLKAKYTIGLDSKAQELALTASAFGEEVIGFYIQNGRTYLNYLGTKSSSLASNIGFDEDKNFRLGNPLLEIPREDREKLFKSVTVNGNRYTFNINTTEADKILDQYGAVKVENARLTASIEDTNLKSMSLTVDGVYSIETNSVPFDLTADFIVDSTSAVDELVFPSDLSSWPEQ